MHLYNVHTHQLNKSQERAYEESDVFNLQSVAQFDDLSTQYLDIYFSCGIHPWHVHDSPISIDDLEHLLHNNRIIAIGEAGLDKYVEKDIEYQIQVFEQQILLAKQACKPMIIHCVKAWDELIALYKVHKPDMPWIIHGYRGKVEQTRQLVRLGFKFSLGEYFNAESLSLIPLNSLFCETDTSDTSIYTIYKNVVQVLNISIEELAEIIDINMRQLIS